jgi:hypothetical protein
MLGKPGLASVKAAPVFLGHGFMVGLGLSRGAGDDVEEHQLQGADGRADLRVRQPFDEIGRVMFPGS